MTSRNTGSETLRLGTVASVHPERHRVRVLFPDKDGMVSDELPVLTHGALKNNFQCLPDVGEQVLCAFLPNGEESGFVLGSVYSETDRPAKEDKDEYLLKIPGGVCVSVNRAAHTVALIDSHGSRIVMAGGDITIQSAGKIYLNPPDGVAVPEHVKA